MNALAVKRLHAARPRRMFVVWSVRSMVGIMAASWFAGDFGLAGWFTPRRQENLERYLGELRPWPLQGRDWDTGVAWEWTAGLWRDHLGEAVLATLAISVAAIVIAGFVGALLSLPAARTVARARPFLPGGRTPSRVVRSGWSLLVGATRFLLVFLRSIPEYVWAFLLLALLGPTAWPMVLALALHNAGILGKLTAEVVENASQRAPGALRGVGAGRGAVVFAAIVPETLPRFLLYFFYRWETCVREATVLGMLGMASLGFWITDARARNRYDEMLAAVIAGAVLVLLGDVVSALVRRAVRRA